MPSKVQIYAQLAEDTGRQIMKDYEQADTVRKIFKWYAEGILLKG